MNGIIIINKPAGYTSHDIVYKIKKQFKEKVGHTGTLDPMATGVLPILIGKATRCSKYLINHDKIYEVTLTLGKKTDTADVEGKILEEQEINDDCLNETKVKEILRNFVGKQNQIPPMYSAIKLNGKKLYEYARKGEKVEIQPREIEIYDIDLLNIEKQENSIEFKVHCSKGTYIRSLCEDIATKLGTIGYMSKLNRIQVGEFNIKDAITFEQLKNVDETFKDNRCFITVEQLFKNKPSINLNNKKLEQFLNGVKLKIDKADDVYKIYNNNVFLGTGIIENSTLKRDIIL